MKKIKKNIPPIPEVIKKLERILNCKKNPSCPNHPYNCPLIKKNT